MLKCTTHVVMKHNKKKFDKNKDHRIIIMDIKHGHLWRKNILKPLLRLLHLHLFQFLNLLLPEGGLLCGQVPLGML